MLHSVKKLLGRQLSALDDRVGHVADIYFDERTWTIRYLSIDADWWNPPCRALISPQCITAVPEEGHFLSVNLTREQLEEAPVLELRERITRVHEIDHYCYYNWPFYWRGGALWGPTDLPLGNPPTVSQSRREPPSVHDSSASLRGLHGMLGFPVQSAFEAIGRVDDFLMDDKRWQIHYLVMAEGHLLLRRTMLVGIRKLLPIDWQGERINITPTQTDVARIFLRREFADA